MASANAAERLTEDRVGGHKQKTAASMMIGDRRHPAAQRTDAVAFRERAEVGGNQHRVQRQRIGVDVLAATPRVKMCPGLQVGRPGGLRDRGIRVAGGFGDGLAERAVHQVLEPGRRPPAGDPPHQGQRAVG